MIRKLEPDEVAICCQAGAMFFDEGKIPGGFDAHVFSKTWARIIRQDSGVILGAFEGITFVGGLGAVLAPDPNNGQTMAVECFWYVIPEHRGHGIKLLKAFEQWGAQRGAHRLAMIHLMALQPETLGKLYERMGYKAIEVNYIKELRKP